MNSGMLRKKMMVFATCAILLGLSVEAAAQESTSINGVGLNLGMSKDVVLRKISETGLGPRKISDVQGCELWMAFTQESEQKKAESQDKRGWSLQFCDDKMVFAEISGNPRRDADRIEGAPLAESMIDALTHLETENKVCSIETWSHEGYRDSEISCGELHVSVSVNTEPRFKFGIVTETLGKRVLPKAKK